MFYVLAFLRISAHNLGSRPRNPRTARIQSRNTETMKPRFKRSFIHDMSKENKGIGFSEVVGEFLRY
jgi:hypothetical protein